LNPGFDANRIAMSVPLTRVLLPAQLFFFLGGLLMGVMYSRKQFLIPAFGPVIYNAGIIFGAIVLRPFFPPHVAIQGLVWGALGGAFIGNLMLPFIGVSRLGVKFTPSFEVLHPAAKKVWRMLLPIGLGVGLPSIDQVVNKYFASYFGTGDTTALMNAYRLMLLPIGVFAQSMAIAVFPTLSSQAAEKDYKAMRGTLNQSLRNILFLTLPSTALIVVLANPIITFLLQSGKYTGSDSAVTASVLCYLALGIFAWSCSSLLTRGFYALQSSKVPAISGAVVSVIFILMNWLVVRYRLGISWIAISTSVSAAIHCFALLFLLSRRLKGIQRGRLIASVAKTFVATIALSVVAYILNRAVIALSTVVWMPPKVEAILSLTVAGGLGLLAFYGVARALKMPELETGVKMVASKLGGVKKLLGRR
jgi:putative peptidoglycan lipid II flippase